MVFRNLLLFVLLLPIVHADNCYKCYSVRYSTNDRNYQKALDEASDQVSDRRCEQDQSDFLMNPSPTCNGSGSCVYTYGDISYTYSGYSIRAHVWDKDCSTIVSSGCRHYNDGSDLENSLPGSKVLHYSETRCYCNGDLCNSKSCATYIVCSSCLSILLFLIYIISVY